MNRWRVVRLVLGVAVGGLASVALAQQALEIIPLRHGTVEQVLPVLQPLLEPGATLSGSRGQLFLRASPANAAEIKRALAAIDRPAKRLMISVRFEGALDRERRAVQGSATVGSGGARVAISAEDSRRSADERVDQRVQVLEGGWASIADSTSGFEVMPRLAGRDVVLEILQGRDRRQSQQVLSTTVTARLGEWVELGAVAQSASSAGRGIGVSDASRRSDSRRVWVKVEEAAN